MSPVLEAGQTLGPYQIRSLIGAGGMAEVYKATDTRLNRLVAVKVLQSASRASRARLLNEARAISRLSHPHICALFDIGQTESHDYLVMEFLQGETLADRVSRGRLPIESLIGYGIQIAEALEAAHRQGLIHRDLKPANIMLTEVGAKLLDFGIAELHELHASETSGATQTDERIDARLGGTLAYMAPEQLEGRPCDARTDLFALGTTLFEMAAGRRPHEASSTVGLVTAILRDDPLPLRRVRREVPGPLEHLVRWTLSKDQSDRPPNAAAVATELRIILRRLEAAVTRPARPVSAPPKKRTSVQHLRRLAILPLVNLSGDPEQEYFADGMTDAIIASLAMLGSLKVISRTSVAHYKRTTKTLPQIAQELRVDAILEGSVAKYGDRVRIIVELVDAASDAQVWSASFNRQLDDALLVQDDVARGVAGQIRLKLSERERARLNRRRRVDREARENFLLGSYLYRRYDRESLDRSLTHLQRAIELDPRFPEAHAALADWHVRAVVDHMVNPNGLAAGIQAAEHALALDPDLAEAYGVLGTARTLLWDFARADEAYVRALELKPSYAEVHIWYARLLLYRLAHDAALRETERALELDPLSVRTLVGAATVQFSVGQLDESLRQCARAIDLEPGCAPAFYFRGNVHVRRQQWEEAVASLVHSHELAPGHPSPLSGLGYAYGRAGRRDEALATISALQQLKLEGDPRRISISLAEVCMGLGDDAQAIAHLETAFAARVPELVTVACDPIFEPLHSNPQFVEMMRRMGLSLERAARNASG